MTTVFEQSFVYKIQHPDAGYSTSVYRSIPAEWSAEGLPDVVGDTQEQKSAVRFAPNVISLLSDDEDE